MLVTFSILALTIALLLYDKWPMEIVAILCLLALLLCGQLEVHQALSGFANPTVISITALFVIGGGLFHSGVADWLAQHLVAIAGTSETRFVLLLGTFTALLSAFLSNTGTIAVLLPAVIAAARRMGVSPSRLLMPLAFAGQIGGLLTLVGTPPNIVIANTLKESGLGSFSFFEFSLIGLPMLGVFLAYCRWIAPRLIPDRADKASEVQSDFSTVELSDAYRLKGHFYRLRVRQGSPLIGQPRGDAHLTTRYGVQILKAVPGELTGHQDHLDTTITPTDYSQRIEADTVLLVQGNEEDVTRLSVECNLAIQAIDEEGRSALSGSEMGLAEVLIRQRSTLAGISIKQVRFADTYRVQVLGVMRGGESLPLPFIHEPLRFGDALLVFGRWKDIQTMKRNTRNFIVVGKPELDQKPQLTRQGLIALALMATMVLMLLTNVLPMVTTLLMIAVAMILGGCLATEQAYRAISWQSVILIAAMLPLSVALDASGGAAFVADGLVKLLQGAPPLALLAGIYLLTMVFSQFISNTATTILVAPIALSTATSLGYAPQAVLMAVAAGASSAFLTPIASPVNTLVLGPGNYRFADFARAGLPLVVLTLVTCLLVIPLFWPL